MVGNVGFYPWGGGYMYGNRCCRQPYFGMPFNIFSPYDYSTAIGISAGNRKVLQIRYSSLTTNLNALLQTISANGSNYKLTEEEKAKYEALKAKVLALQKQVYNYGINSANIMIYSATDKVNQYRSEYFKLRDAEAMLKAAVDGRISSQTTTQTPETGTQTPETGTETPEQVTPPETVTETPEVTPTGEENDGIIEDNETVDELKQKYESELKTSLEEMIADPDITAEDKQKLEAKKKELEDAIAANKTPEEIKKIYGELADLMVEVMGRIEAAKATRTQQELTTLLKDSANLVTNVKKFTRDNNNYTDSDDRTKLAEKIQELEAAIEAKKPLEEIKTIYNELNTLYTTIKNKTTQLIEQADEICGEILNASSGIDWNIFTESENEKKIKAAVKKINKTNVRHILNRWDEVYKSSSGDSCLLETIYGEFKSSTNTKNELTTHIANAIKEYAKSKGASEKISGYLQIIQGKGSYSDKYNAFNKIITELNKMA